MKIELCNKIKIIPVQYVLTQTAEYIIPLANRHIMEFTTDGNEFKQESAEQNANPYFKQSLECTVKRITVEQTHLLLNSKVMVILETTKGIKRVWGSREYRVTCNIEFFPDGAKLKLSCDAVEPVIF
ncbi:MAG: hypothetical protein LBK94_04970 [Prevotellaceae bacterium]|nr:hypothetical protein [Prevotellaceae bacterium]